MKLLGNGTENNKRLFFANVFLKPPHEDTYVYTGQVLRRFPLKVFLRERKTKDRERHSFIHEMKWLRDKKLIREKNNNFHIVTCTMKLAYKGQIPLCRYFVRYKQCVYPQYPRFQISVILFQQKEFPLFFIAEHLNTRITKPLPFH